MSEREGKAKNPKVPDKPGDFWTEEKRKQLREMASGGVPIERMCDEMGCDAGSLTEQAKKDGVELRDGGAGRG